MIGQTNNTAPATTSPIPDDAELQQALERVNQLAAQGQYREARDVLHTLRMLYPEHTDAFTEMDDAFFAAERERNGKMGGINPFPMWCLSSNTLNALGAIFAFTALFLWSVLLPEIRRGTLPDTYRAARSGKQGISVPWAIGSTLGSLLCFGGGFILRRFEE